MLIELITSVWKFSNYYQSWACGLLINSIRDSWINWTREPLVNVGNLVDVTIGKLMKISIAREYGENLDIPTRSYWDHKKSIEAHVKIKSYRGKRGTMTREIETRHDND